MQAQLKFPSKSTCCGNKVFETNNFIFIGSMHFSSAMSNTSSFWQHLKTLGGFDFLRNGTWCLLCFCFCCCCSCVFKGALSAKLLVYIMQMCNFYSNRKIVWKIKNYTRNCHWHITIYLLLVAATVVAGESLVLILFLILVLLRFVLHQHDIMSIKMLQEKWLLLVQN